MQAIKAFVKDHPHMWWGLFLPIYLAAFFTIEHFITDNYWATELPLDRLIPFCPYFIAFYMSWSPLLAVLGIYLILRTPRASAGISGCWHCRSSVPRCSVFWCPTARISARRIWR